MKYQKTLVERARSFATQAHGSIGQKRKFTGEPYIIHPAAVAKLVSTVTTDENLISAAWLHDTVEDTPVSLEDIELEFGPQVAELVEQLTDVSRPEDGNRKVRKALDREHTRKASPGAKTVKLADCIHNAETILRDDPHFATVFMRELRDLLEVLVEGDADLYQKALGIVEGYEKKGKKNPSKIKRLSRD